MKRKKKGIRLIYLIILFVMLITPIAMSIYKLSTFPMDHEIIREETVKDILDMSEGDKTILTYNYLYENNEENYFSETEKIVEPHIDNVTNTKYITYEDIGIVDTQEDSYEIIRKTHEIANEYGYEVRATLDEYHIYKLEYLQPIYIKTNTNWNNAKFVIHDEDIKDLQTRNYPIFQILSDEKEIIINNAEILNSIKIGKETKKIKELSGYGRCLCVVYNSNKKQYIRNGYNNSIGNDQLDLLRIDNDGNVLNDIQWNFESITKIKLIPIPEEKILIQNGNFQTNLDKDQNEQASGYLNRNIACSRSNTILKNINHSLNDEDKLGGPYFGFVRISSAADVELLDCKLVAHKYKSVSNYDLVLEYSTNITLNNVTSDYIEENDRWGIIGTNYTKDITYKNCKLNRIDAHCGVYNLTIDNCTIGVKGITVIGGGKLKITNTSRIGAGSFIELRSDYGSVWNGNIEIENCKYDMKENNKLISLKVIYDSDGKIHDYGYEKILPNIYINNLEIQNNAKNDDKIYLFYNNEYYLENKTGSLLEAGYTLPKEIVIDNYLVNTGKPIKAFYQDNNEHSSINVNINIPNRPILNMQDENNEEYQSGNLTNKTIYLKLDTLDNIENELQINGQAIKEKSAKIEKTGIYNIIITSIDIAGNVKKDEYQVNIDKTAPIIQGLENNVIYETMVTPKIEDSDIATIYLYKDEVLLQNYELNSKIDDKGRYKLEVTDKAGNTTIVNFEVKETIKNIEQYIVKDKYITNILPNTNKETFFKNSKLSAKLKISRNNENVLETDILKTGDVLYVNDEKYTLIVNGDISQDGKVSIVDVMQVKRYITSNEEITDIKRQAADINKDEKIDVMDVMKIIKMSLAN